MATRDTNDNYCLSQVVVNSNVLVKSQLNKQTSKTAVKTRHLDVNSPAANHVPSVTYIGLPQKKGISPAPYKNKIKSVKGVCCVNPCLSVPCVHNAHTVAKPPNVGGRLQQFWQVWQELGANPRVVSIIRDGYSLPFKQRPPLSRVPVVLSGYANPRRNKVLKQALLTLQEKLVVERVLVRSSLTFYNRLFLVPKPNGKWRPILDLSQLNFSSQTRLSKWRLRNRSGCPSKKESG